MRILLSALWGWIVILFISLGLAYWASLPEANQIGKSPTQNIERNSIHVVELSLHGGTTVAERGRERSEQWWIRTSFGTSDEDSAATAAPKFSRFLASEKFTEYLRMLGKFPAQREIGLLADSSLSEFGFINTSNILRLNNKNGQALAEFLIGRQPYGARSFYVMRKSDKKVFLVGADLVDDMAKPQARFFERDVSKMKLEKAKMVRITMAENVRSFVRRSQDDRGTPQWADESAQGQVIPGLGQWLEKFSEIKAATYADDDLLDSLRRVQPVFKLSMVDDKNRSENFEMRSIGRNGATEFYLTSEFSSWPVKVATARAENLVRDLPPLLQN